MAGVGHHGVPTGRQFSGRVRRRGDGCVVYVSIIIQRRCRDGYVDAEIRRERALRRPERRSELHGIPVSRPRCDGPCSVRWSAGCGRPFGADGVIQRCAAIGRAVVIRTALARFARQSYRARARVTVHAVYARSTIFAPVRFIYLLLNMKSIFVLKLLLNSF